MTGKTCEHLIAAERRTTPVRPAAHGCVECLAAGDVWVHLRLCLACGHVGCCDDSPNRHATRHAHATGHPVIRSFEPGEDWAYCYPDDAFVEELRTLHGEAAPRHYGPPR